MILNQSPKQNVVNTAISSTTLRISEDAKDQALLVDLQISKLYKNKIQSVIREYISNAKDANIAAGKDVPVKITLPSPSHLFFEVSDSGLGMSPEEIDKYFCSVGSSSKRDTNTQIGSFGLGLKCGFAYVKQYGFQFNITTISNGVKYYYVAHYDEQNFPRISLLGSEETEEVGTTISIPVSPNDVGNFYNSAKLLLTFWKSHLKFEVVGTELPLEIGEVFYECPEFTIYYPTRIDNFFINSCVASIAGLPYNFAGANMYGFVAVANIGIGVLDLIPSREELEDTKNNKDILSPIFETAKKIIHDHYQKKVDSFASEFDLWEYIKKFDDEHITSFSKEWYPQVCNQLKFRGNPIEFSKFDNCIYQRRKYDFYYIKDYKKRPILYVHSSKVGLSNKLERIEELREGFRVVAFCDCFHIGWHENSNPNYFADWPQFSKNLREQFLARSTEYSTIKKVRPKREQTSEPSAWFWKISVSFRSLMMFLN